MAKLHVNTLADWLTGLPESRVHVQTTLGQTNFPTPCTLNPRSPRAYHVRELLCPLCPMMVPGQVLRLIQHDQLCAARGYDLGDIPHRQDPQDVRIVPPRKPHHLCRQAEQWMRSLLLTEMSCSTAAVKSFELGYGG